MRRQFTRMLDEVLIGAVSRQLGTAGFRGGGRRWRRDLPECIQMIAAHVLTPAGSREFRFALTLSVYAKPIELLLGRNLRKRPSEASFHWSVSLRQLESPNALHSWLLDESSEASDVAVDVWDKLSRFGLPCLEQAKTMSGFADLLTANPPIGKQHTKQLDALVLRVLERIKESKARARDFERGPSPDDDRADLSEKLHRFLALM